MPPALASRAGPMVGVAVPRWALIVPLSAVALLAVAMLWPVGPVLAWLSAGVLMLAVLAAVHHAEVVAHRVGEPFGTLVLALAVTVIEVALIVSVMLTGGADNATLPRDTIFSAVMIICNGVVGLCLVVGGLRHHEQTFRIEGATSSLAALIALATLSLVLPSFTTSAPGATYTRAQLAFAAVASLGLWAVFVFVQTVRHRDYFLPAAQASNQEVHAAPPSAMQAGLSFLLLMVSLVGVVGLAKVLSPSIERAVAVSGAPKTVIGIAIALLVLLPETWAAVRAARLDRLQTSFNLAYGSALASIGLTIPAVAVASVWLGLPLVLGLDAKDLVLLTLTFVVSAITLAHGRTHMMQGAVHLVIFAAFAFLALVP
jgi:Ca2+:H+ antiporter